MGEQAPKGRNHREALGGMAVQEASRSSTGSGAPTGPNAPLPDTAIATTTTPNIALYVITQIPEGAPGGYEPARTIAVAYDDLGRPVVKYDSKLGADAVGGIAALTRKMSEAAQNPKVGAHAVTAHLRPIGGGDPIREGTTVTAFAPGSAAPYNGAHTAAGNYIGGLKVLGQIVELQVPPGRTISQVAIGLQGSEGITFVETRGHTRTITTTPLAGRKP